MAVIKRFYCCEFGYIISFSIESKRTSWNLCKENIYGVKPPNTDWIMFICNNIHSSKTITVPILAMQRIHKIYFCSIFTKTSCASIARSKSRLLAAEPGRRLYHAEYTDLTHKGLLFNNSKKYNVVGTQTQQLLIIGNVWTALSVHRTSREQLVWSEVFTNVATNK